MPSDPGFADIFRKATGKDPFDWQTRYATSTALAEVVGVPTGAGKTEAAIVGWLWRRRFADPDTRRSTPRRLVYCLPMRTLVEQTRERAAKIIDQLDLADEVNVHLLMGGAVARDWILEPERDAILIGTLDQLLSRALMRGYGESRFRWPIDFAFLNSDALWVCDEVQLFGEALTTTTQLDGLRRKLPPGPGPTGTVWMSATLDPEWLESVDRPRPTSVCGLSEADRAGTLAARLNAKKTVSRLEAITADIIHQNAAEGTLTLVVVNTVAEARDLYLRVKKLRGDAPTVLLHSRFRPQDRKALVDRVMKTRNGVVISTQVVEAGVDIDAETLITAAAPWASIVQRIGRCNRYGERDTSTVLWAEPDKSLPYDEAEVQIAVDALTRLEGESLSPQFLTGVDVDVKRPARRHTLRRTDLLDLFDTTPDIGGLDTDISRFVRESDDLAAMIAWRAIGDRPSDDEPAIERDEFCPAALSELAKLREVIQKKDGDRRKIFRFDPIGAEWRVLGRDDRVRPGDRLLVDSSFGCYTADGGFDPKSTANVAPVAHGTTEGDEGIGQDPESTRSSGSWQTVSSHTRHVIDRLERLLDGLALAEEDVAPLREAARWHDAGKAHEVFQSALEPTDADSPPPWIADAFIAKRIGRGKRYERPGFRHELASMLWYLEADGSSSLVAYLIAAHHGRVRLGARSVPRERRPDNGRGFVLGVWDGDEMPACRVVDGLDAPEAHLDLTYLQLGRRGAQPYTARALDVLDDLGPFRLAYLEATLRIADQLASKSEEVPDAQA